MPAPFFRFKQFTVWHNQCAMKVGTDGVLLGAWAPVDTTIKRILDIGCGSGLVALMLAQRCPDARITAIDIDQGAYHQSVYNFEQSPWSNRLTALHSSLQEFNFHGQRFDLVVSNPPWFSNSLRNPGLSRATARHDDTLPLETLLKQADKLVNETGSIVVILPVSDSQKCVKLAERFGFYCNSSVVIIPKPGAEPKRVLLAFNRTEKQAVVQELVLETQNRGEYTPDFAALVRDFYLKL